MHIPIPIFAMALLLAMLVAASPLAAAGGRITARISLADRNGQVVYGDWVRVFLVTAAIEIPDLNLTDAEAVVEKTSRVNSAHMTFFIRFRAMMDREGYHLDDKLTRPDGSVAFSQVPPGRYYLVVTFPTMIAGQKAAWQVPVEVVDAQTMHVELNTSNMAFGAF